MYSYYLWRMSVVATMRYCFVHGSTTTRYARSNATTAAAILPRPAALSGSAESNDFYGFVTLASGLAAIMFCLVVVAILVIALKQLQCCHRRRKQKEIRLKLLARKKKAAHHLISIKPLHDEEVMVRVDPIHQHFRTDLINAMISGSNINTLNACIEVFKESLCVTARYESDYDLLTEARLALRSLQKDDLRLRLATAVDSRNLSVLQKTLYEISILRRIFGLPSKKFDDPPFDKEIDMATRIAKRLEIYKIEGSTRDEGFHNNARENLKEAVARKTDMTGLVTGIDVFEVSVKTAPVYVPDDKLLNNAKTVLDNLEDAVTNLSSKLHRTLSHAIETGNLELLQDTMENIEDLKETYNVPKGVIETKDFDREMERAKFTVTKLSKGQTHRETVRKELKRAMTGELQGDILLECIENFEKSLMKAPRDLDDDTLLSEAKAMLREKHKSDFRIKLKEAMEVKDLLALRNALHGVEILTLSYKLAGISLKDKAFETEVEAGKTMVVELTKKDVVDIEKTESEIEHENARKKLQEALTHPCNVKGLVAAIEGFEVTLGSAAYNQDDYQLLTDGKEILHQTKSKVNKEKEKLLSLLKPAIGALDRVELLRVLDKINSLKEKYNLPDGKFDDHASNELVEKGINVARRLSEVEQASQKVKSMTVQSIAEIRSYQNPPVAVLASLTGTFILLGEKEQHFQTWLDIKQFLGRMGRQDSLKSRADAFQPSKVNLRDAGRVWKLISQTNLSEVQACSTAVAHFYIWCQATLETVKLLHDIQDFGEVR